MPRPLSGSVLTRRLADGRLTYDVKIRADRKTLGAEPDWDPRRAQRLLDDVLLPAAKLGQPWWERIPGRVSTTAVGSPVGVVPDFHGAASDYVHSLGRYSNPATRNAYSSPVVKHLLPYFAYEDAERLRPRRLDAITGALVTEFTLTKQAERVVLVELPSVLAELDDDVLCDPDALASQLDAREWELLRRYGQRGGRRAVTDPEATGRVSISSRGLSPNEINRCLARLRDIVRMANRTHGLSLPDPTEGRRLPPKDPPRAWIRPRQLQACLDAARELDEREPLGQDYRMLGRESAVLALALAGPRVSEFGGARWLHLHDDEWHVPEAKTSAGVRDIKLHRVLADALAARRERMGAPTDEFVWATAAGTRRDRNSVRNRLLAPVLARADELLEERGQRPLPARVTPHAFRRTYLTYCAWAGKPQRFAMQQAGHKAAKLTLECYQQPLPDDPQERAMVKRWLS